jgi:hypothetical protein
MPVLRVNPKLDFAENLILNGIDPVEFIKDYSTVIANFYLPVTEGSGDISSVIRSGPQTRGGSRYRKLRTTRRLKGGATEDSVPLKKSSATLRTVCTIVMVIGLAGLAYYMSDSAVIGELIETAQARVSDAKDEISKHADSCSLSGIKEAAQRAGNAAVAEWSAGWKGLINRAFDTDQRAESIMMEDGKREGEEIARAGCMLLQKAARDAVSSLVALEAQSKLATQRAIGSLCVAGVGNFFKRMITSGNAAFNQAVSDGREALNSENRNAEAEREKLVAEGKAALEAESRKEPKIMGERGIGSAAAVFQSRGGANHDDDDILYFDTDTHENIVGMMKAQASFLGGEKIKAAAVRSVLSLVGAAEPVSSISGQEISNAPTSNVPKKGGANKEVSYLEVKKTLALIGVLPDVIDIILARTANPSLSEPAKENISK